MREVSIENGRDIAPAEPTAKRKAISYIRYSSAEQGREGRNSTQRQQNALQEALAHWNLELDQQFIDKAKSGYHQRHLAKGGAMYRLAELSKRPATKRARATPRPWKWLDSFDID